MTTVTVRGFDLTINDVVRVARHGDLVKITDDPETLGVVHTSQKRIMNAVEAGEIIYGVTTNFGGMSNIFISHQEAEELQNNALWTHWAGAGKWLPTSDVRAAMLIRSNSHLRGASGLRLELIQRMAGFLNANVTPRVPEFGSIGASGDLVPLTYIAGALIGADDSFTVDFNGREMGAISALNELGLPRLNLQPKEGLAMINGTSLSTGIAANCAHTAQHILTLTLGIHALAIQALAGTRQSFHPYLHAHKPHPGQVWVAQEMLRLLDGSKFIDSKPGDKPRHPGDELIQDRYSLRCLPQYLGPIVDNLIHIVEQVEIEINSTTDNPLIDPDTGEIYYGGNFLGEYIGVAMDQLRYHIGLCAKHLDVQIAMLMMPEFSNGLPPSLIGNPNRAVNAGLKGLQLTGTSIMPLLTFLGNSLADRFPTHAEQFNQNINSQSFGSANLARQSIETMQHYLAIMLLIVTQAVDLRTFALMDHYNARDGLSPMTISLYEAIRHVINKPPSLKRPYVWNDNEQILHKHIANIVDDLINGGQIIASLSGLSESLAELRQT